jgi:hypothetical protein
LGAITIFGTGGWHYLYWMEIQMKGKLIAVVVLTALFVSTSHAGDREDEALKAGGAAAGGAVVGGATFAAVGSGGLAIAGTAVTIGAAPFVAAGAVIGLAGYGIYRVFSDPTSTKEVPVPQPGTAKPPQTQKR